MAMALEYARPITWGELKNCDRVRDIERSKSRKRGKKRQRDRDRDRDRVRDIYGIRWMNYGVCKGYAGLIYLQLQKVIWIHLFPMEAYT